MSARAAPCPRSSAEPGSTRARRQSRGRAGTSQRVEPAPGGPRPSQPRSPGWASADARRRSLWHAGRSRGRAQQRARPTIGVPRPAQPEWPAPVSKANTKIEDTPVRTIIMGEVYLERKETGKSQQFLCLIGEKGKVLLTFFTAR